MRNYVVYDASKQKKRISIPHVFVACRNRTFQRIRLTLNVIRVGAEDAAQVRKLIRLLMLMIAD